MRSDDLLPTTVHRKLLAIVEQMSFLPILTQHGAAPPVATFREDGITMVPSSGPFAHPLLNVIFKALRRVSLPPLASTRIAQAVFLDLQFEHGHTKTESE
ncbi:hypothetical protein SANT12839_004080 [Streptomyces antimycoticus]|uniref:Uncharacterized protein n=2 Tax=Streptomyces antimycoticus TaxID=68175 RepID=A0A4D4JYL8_9ACTN|nr:hypothetical protein SANT12839_004080 [Streptomyces antimycoticus]